MMNKNYYKFGWLKNLSNPIKSWKVGKRQKVRKGLKIWTKLLQSQKWKCVLGVYYLMKTTLPKRRILLLSRQNNLNLNG